MDDASHRVKGMGGPQYGLGMDQNQPLCTVRTHHWVETQSPKAKSVSKSAGEYQLDCDQVGMCKNKIGVRFC